MSENKYLNTVNQYLESDGWEIRSEQLRPGTVLIRGRQQSASGNESIVVMVVTSEDGNVTIDHLQHLHKRGRKLDADLAVLAAELEIDAELQQTAADNGITLLDDEILADIEANRSASNDGLSSTWRLHKEAAAYFGRKREKLSRRAVIGSVGVLAAGVASGSYGWRRLTHSRVDSIKSDAESVAYDNLVVNIEQYVGTVVHYSPAKIAQVVDSEGVEYRFRIQVTETDDEWTNDLLGRWNGDVFLQNETVEFLGVVDGLVQYETELGHERTIPVVEIFDISLIDQ